MPRLSRALGLHIESVGHRFPEEKSGGRVIKRKVIRVLVACAAALLAFVAWTSCGSPKLIEDYPLSTDYADGGAR